MEREQITAIFDQAAAVYDQQWSRLAPIYGALHTLAEAVLADLPATARVLCVGAGTGAEILHLAQRFPGWCFTAVEPSRAMLAVFEQRAAQQGILDRCVLHLGYLDSLPPHPPYDAALSVLVSQFLVDPEQRAAFFQQIAARLKPQGLLISADLAGDLLQGEEGSLGEADGQSAAESEALLGLWHWLMNGGHTTPEHLARTRAAYTRDVAVIPASKVRHMIRSGGFEDAVLFFQAGLLHAWYARPDTRDKANAPASDAVQ